MVVLARPELEALAAAVGEAAGLSVPDGFRVHYVDQVDTPNPVVGPRLDRHPGPDARRAVRAGPARPQRRRPASSASSPGRWRRFTPATVTDPAALRERLRRVQLDGYAWVFGEFSVGINSVAAAVADEDGEVVAAVHLHGPSYRFPSAGGEERIGEEVVAAAARISARLRQGGRATIRRNSGDGEDLGRL